MSETYWDRIEQALGPTAVAALIERWGGRRVYVPDKVTKDSPLAVLLGYPEAAALTRIAGGIRISVPKTRRVLKAQRDRAIREAYANDIPAASLARDYALTERRVFQIVAPAAPKPPALRRPTMEEIR